jgi:predicted ArsR family transcriptional regulator
LSHIIEKIEEKEGHILNSVSNDIGFMSSLHTEADGTYSLISRNCILHKVALSHQDAICNGLHSRMIEKALDGKVNPDVQLKECIALGSSYSKHVISINNKKKNRLKA